MTDPLELERRGLGVSPGIQVGPVLFYESADFEVPRRTIEPALVEAEISRIRQALYQAEADLVEQRNRMTEGLDGPERLILETHLEFLRDAVFRAEIENRILRKHVNAEAAVEDQVQKISALLAGSGHLFRERAADIRDVGNRLQRVLLERGRHTVEQGGAPFILYARELLPTDTMSLEKHRLLAIVTELGGDASHMAILARAFGIPAVTGIKGLPNLVAPGEEIGVDGGAGVVHLSIDARLRVHLLEARARFAREREELAARAASTSRAEEESGVAVLLNVENFEGLDLDLLRSTHGVGLYRTEFLFFGRNTFPSEEEQFQFYKSVLEQVGPREVTFRTIDVGGDKPLKYLQTPKEQNPALGWRGIRLTFEWPDLLIPQLRALLRAAVHGRVHILLPMVTNVEEVREARQMFLGLGDDLRRAGHPFRRDVPLGAMIEVPAAAIAVAEIAREVDFLSIGTNDLLQYLFAVDRNNLQVSRLYQPLHPVMLRVLKSVLEAAERLGKPVTVCGEMAGQPLSALALLGLGLRRFSMSPAHVPETRWILEHHTQAEARQLVEEVIEFDTARRVEERLRRAVEDRAGRIGGTGPLPGAEAL